MPISLLETFLQHYWRVESETKNGCTQFVPAAQIVEETSAAAPALALTAPEPAEKALRNEPNRLALDIAHATRTWIQYGIVGFAVMCIVIGAIKGVLAR